MPPRHAATLFRAPTGLSLRADAAKLIAIDQARCGDIVLSRKSGLWAQPGQSWLTTLRSLDLAHIAEANLRGQRAVGEVQREPPFVI